MGLDKNISSDEHKLVGAEKAEKNKFQMPLNDFNGV